MSRGETEQEAPSSRCITLAYSTRQRRKAGRTKVSPLTPLLRAPTSHSIYWNRKNPEKRSIPLATCPHLHPVEPLVLVFIHPAFNPSLGEEDSTRNSKGPRT